MSDNRYRYIHFMNKCIFFIKYLSISDILKQQFLAFSKIYSIKTTIRKYNIILHICNNLKCIYETQILFSFNKVNIETTILITL